MGLPLLFFGIYIIPHNFASRKALSQFFSNLLFYERNATAGLRQFLFPVRLLSVVWEPFAFGQLHIGKGCPERRILGAASIDAKANASAALPHMAHTHLLENNTVLRAFDQIIVLAAAESIPHGPDARIDLGGCPVGIAVVGYHAAQVLEAIVFIFDRGLEPVVAVKIHDNAALVKPALTIELCFDGKRKEFLLCFHLQHGGIVVSEMVLGSLPQICMWLGDDFNDTVRYGIIGRLSGPPKQIDVKVHIHGFLLSVATGIIFFLPTRP